MRVIAAVSRRQSTSECRASRLGKFTVLYSRGKMNWRSLNWAKSLSLSLLSVPLNQSEVTSLRESHTYSTHRRSSDALSVYLLCSCQLTSRGHIPSQPVCDGQVDTHTHTHTHTHTNLSDVLDSPLLITYTSSFLFCLFVFLLVKWVVFVQSRLTFKGTCSSLNIGLHLKISLVCRFTNMFVSCAN